MSGCFCVGPPGRCPCMQRQEARFMGFNIPGHFVDTQTNKEIRDRFLVKHYVFEGEQTPTLKPHIIGPPGVIREVKHA